MNRRQFMQTVGATGASAIIGADRVLAATSETGGKAPIKTLNREEVANRNQNRSTVICRNGIVCTSQPLAGVAGLDVLKAGGNAVDAAVCANAMLGVVEPMSCGIGGDLFAIIWLEKERKLFGLNASGRAPYEWNLDKAKELGLTSIPEFHPLAWNVPGCVSGWAALLERFGSRPLSELLSAPLAYAREGFPVSSIIADSWEIDARKHPFLAETYLPDGKRPAYGDIFKNPQLAETYAMLARDGAGAFYRGEIAERLVRFCRANGGYFSKRDFEDHTATWVEPETTSYRGFDVWEIPPNGQGISVLQILNMLELFDIGSLEPNSAEHLHLFIEAKKLAYADRAVYYADMDFADVPVKWLISKEYGRERAKLINPKRAATTVVYGKSPGSDTVYLTTADRNGNMVSLIQSIYYNWGSRIVPDRLGFSMQNRGTSFRLDPAHRNRLEPHKRPFHTIIPAFVTRAGRPLFSFGVMGGDFQPQGHSQVLMNLIDYGMSPQMAGDQPRIEHDSDSELPGGKINLERGIADGVRQALADMGHHVSAGDDTFGGYQGIWREDGPLRYFGGSDPRKDGCAIGY